MCMCEERRALDGALLGEVVGALDGRGHALCGQEGGQVRRVRADQDEREEPPGAAHDATWHRPASVESLHRWPSAFNLRIG